MATAKVARSAGAVKPVGNVVKFPKLTPVDSDLPKWVNSKFKYPKQKIRIGTLFSGIGAVEHALERLGLNHEIVFAGDIDPFVKKSYFANNKIMEKNHFAFSYCFLGVFALFLFFRQI